MTTASAPPSALAGPAPTPLLGHLPAMWRDPIGLFTDGVRRQGDWAGFTFGPYKFMLINHPDHIRHVLLDNTGNYRKSPSYQVLRLILGEGLITSEGELWRRQRKLAQPAFHHKALAGFVATMVRTTAELLNTWSALPAGAALDAHDEMMRLTLRIIGGTLFGTRIAEDTDAIGAALNEVIHFIHHRSLSLWRWPLAVPTPANRRFKRARATLDRLVYRIIAERRRAVAAPAAVTPIAGPFPQKPAGQGSEGIGAAGGVDLLGLYMAARDEDGGPGMTDSQLRDEVMTLVLAGHETTTVVLSWTFDLLSRHPAAERRLRQEVRAVLGDRLPTLEDVERLTYTGWVISESMRLYPPAWILDRQAVEDDTIGGRPVRRGTIVGICPYTLHRHPAFWDNPEGFDPERFSPPRSKNRPRYAYLPFGAGPRTCIGNAFALLEAKIILAMVVQRYRLELIPGHRSEPEPSVTLRPRRGVPVTLHPAPTDPPSSADSFGTAP